MEVIFYQKRKNSKCGSANGLLEKADHVIAVSPQIRTAIMGINKNCTVLPCGVNLLFFNNSLVVVDKNEKQEELVLVFPNDRKIAVKDYPLFENTVQVLAAMLGNNHSIRIVEITNMNREGVRKTLSTADCLLMTSISEGSPQVIKEALACDLPVVSVDVGDVRSMIRDIPFCSICLERSPSLLAEKVMIALKYPKDGSIRKSFAVTKYNNLVITQEIILLYKQLLNQ